MADANNEELQTNIAKQVFCATFFTKLASVGIAPRTEAQADLMVDVGATLLAQAAARAEDADMRVLQKMASAVGLTAPAQAQQSQSSYTDDDAYADAMQLVENTPELLDLL